VTAQLATSPDGQWVACRDGRSVRLFAGATGQEVGRTELDRDDADVALVAPPGGLVAVMRDASTAKVVLYEPPYLEPVARLDLDAPVHLAAITGPRLVLVAPGSKHVKIVREAGRALAHHVIDVGTPVEFAVGLEKNQVLFGLMRKQEVWDAVSGRPVLRPQLPLPPAPRMLGTAAGHLWAIQPGREELFVYRLSDGRPFRHHVGAPVEDVVSHPASPVIVAVTTRGLVRLNCFAHSLAIVDDVPWQPGMPLAQLVAGDDLSLLGLCDGAIEPWRVALGGAVASSETATAPAAVGKPRASADAIAHEPARPPSASPGWRDALVTYGHELARGGEPELPIVTAETELAELARRLELSATARRALLALYAVYLVGEPALPIARLARTVGGWPEALGQGELAALALLRRKHGKVALRTGVTDLLDGAPPRTVRLIGGAPGRPRAGAFRVSRDGRSDNVIEADLIQQLGRLAIVEGSLPAALLEARLHGATAICRTVPDTPPRPWPAGAGLVLVLYGSASSWMADLPDLAGEGPVVTAS
jgi:hypothetical protein